MSLGGATDTGAPIWPPLPLSCASSISIVHSIEVLHLYILLSMSVPTSEFLSNF